MQVTDTNFDILIESSYFMVFFWGKTFRENETSVYWYRDMNYILYTYKNLSSVILVIMCLYTLGF